MTRALPVQLGLTSKSERGYRLRDGTQDAPLKFAGVTLTPDMSARDAFREIGRACLQQIAGNEAAVCKDDAEGVHQMRVGLRRLRAAISLFAALLDDAQTETIKAELKWLTGELGPARELDVLIARVIKPVQRRTSGWDDIPKLSRQFAGQRAAALTRAREAIASERYRLAEDRDRRLAGDRPMGNAAGRSWPRPRRFADRDFRRRAIGAAPAQVPQASQILCRTRRRGGATSCASRPRSCATPAISSTVCFQGNEPDKRREKFLAALETVQDCLGDLNDIAVHENMISAAGMRQRADQPQEGVRRRPAHRARGCAHRRGDGRGRGARSTVSPKPSLIGDKVRRGRFRSRHADDDLAEVRAGRHVRDRPPAPRRSRTRDRSPA